MKPAARHFNRFVQDEEGTAAVLWVISLVAVLGLAGAGFMIGKMGRTHAELQTFVDSVALAAAGELDGRPGALNRATLAANSLISDTNSYGIGTDLDRTLDQDDFVLRFLNGLPLNDTAAIPATYTATTDAAASLVLVSAQPHTVRATLIKGLWALIGESGSSDPTIGATAVAGWAQATCDVTPMMFCLPSHEIALGDMIELRAKGGSGQWSSGNFGFLDIFADNSGICADEQGSEDHCLLSSQEGIGQCVLSNGTVDIDPGQSAGQALAMNNRFDIYDNVTTHFSETANFAPARNIIRGQRIESPGNSNKCDALVENEGTDLTSGATVPITMTLPRDNCLGPTACTDVNVTDPRFGDGEWNKQLYLDTNHPGVDFSNVGYPTGVTLPAGLMGTRYEMYLQEIALLEGGGTTIINPDTIDLETGEPLNETGVALCRDPSPTIHRRTIVVAGISCGSTDPINTGSGKKDIPVDEYYEVFLTEPVVDTPEFGIFGEVIGLPINNGSGTAGPVGVFRDVVQLYR